ncbi:MAG TPA: transglycosylase SLT domain-containing protein [Anaeromyxobacteraceae bacterium]|nr:transglycosylase SLT domain-containing protein [Anaeromyxobacteraceae bacterium]
MGHVAFSSPDVRADEPVAARLEALATAAESLSAGEHAAAVRSARAALAMPSPSSETALANLALGAALAGEGRVDEAASALLAAEPALPEPLRQGARLRLGDALFYGGHPGGAIQVFAAAAGEGPLAERARWREADALLEAGLVRPAARAYQALLERWPRHPAAPGARLSLAAALRAMGDDARALALYREVALDRAADPEGAAAEDALAAWRAAGGPVPEPTAADLLARAERFLQLGRPRRVLETLDALDARGGAAPFPPSALLRSLALLQLNRPVEAEAAARPLLQRADAVAERPAAELALARAASRLGRLGEAARLYRRVAASRPRVPGLSPQQQADLPEDAAYLAAWLSYDAGDFARAAKLLDRYARERPGSKRALDARWFRAWSLHRLGRDREARRAFAALEATPLASGALYWQARLTSDRPRQTALYRAAFRAGEEDWYALLSAARLEGMGLAPPAPAPPPPPRPLPEEAPDPLAARGLGRAMALLGAGLRQEALAELSALSTGPSARVRAPLLAATAAFAGDYDVPFRMARDHLAPTARAQRWAHPEPFPRVLRPAAAGTGVDQWLLLAVMRRESSFRLDARSGAAAEGLLQLIPPTAERLATALGVPLELADRLGEPAVSIGMGAYYLGLLQSRFPDPPALLAAYNAGPQVAAAWATARAGLPLDEWVEAIPYRETRQYVRGVTADWARYRALYGEAPPPLDPAAPVRAPAPGVAF